MFTQFNVIVSLSVSSTTTSIDYRYELMWFKALRFVSSAKHGEFFSIDKE